jgi:hypothetical protein
MFDDFDITITGEEYFESEDFNYDDRGNDYL